MTKTVIIANAIPRQHKTAPTLLANFFRLWACSREIPRALALGRKQTTKNPIIPSAKYHLPGEKPFAAATMRAGMPNRMIAIMLVCSILAAASPHGPEATLGKRHSRVEIYLTILRIGVAHWCSQKVHFLFATLPNFCGTSIHESPQIFARTVIIAVHPLRVARAVVCRSRRGNGRGWQ
jgi:hypothetical protein